MIIRKKYLFYVLAITSSFIAAAVTGVDSFVGSQPVFKYDPWAFAFALFFVGTHHHPSHYTVSVDKNQRTKPGSKNTRSLLQTTPYRTKKRDEIPSHRWSDERDQHRRVLRDYLHRPRP